MTDVSLTIRGTAARADDSIPDGAGALVIDPATGDAWLQSGNSYRPVLLTQPAGGGSLGIDDIYPVGHILIRADATDPATLYAGTTWAQTGSGRVLIGQDPLDTDFDVALETGGSKTHGHADHAALAHAGAAVANHVFTQASGHSAHVFTQSSAHVFTQPSGHSAHVFTQPSGHSNHVVTQPSAHTFTQSSAHSNHAFTQPAAHTNHTFTQPNAHAALATHSHELPFHKVAGATGALRMLASSIFGTGTSRAVESVSAAPTALTTSSAVELSQAVTGGTPDAHAGGAVDAHSAHASGAVDAHSAHSGAGVDAHAGAAVDAHSAHAGGAVDAHSAHAGGGVDAHSGAGVDGHSAHSGAGVDAHGVTQADNHGAQAHAAGTNLPPYMVVYFWKRTA